MSSISLRYYALQAPHSTCLCYLVPSIDVQGSLDQEIVRHVPMLSPDVRHSKQLLPYITPRGSQLQNPQCRTHILTPSKTSSLLGCGSRTLRSPDRFLGNEFTRLDMRHYLSKQNMRAWPVGARRDSCQAEKTVASLGCSSCMLSPSQASHPILQQFKFGKIDTDSHHCLLYFQTRNSTSIHGHNKPLI